ncbi:tegument protein [Murid herpesvirus 3]|uniref:Tegument protein n=2 Tax=Murid betaherpesvirus 3 TaxID=2560603 RepID=A0A1P8VIX8_9BETA|nr:tegument protein [Murine roseolovirus]APZ76304.1 tegument protein [Murid betaherpesvirus 3]AYH64780.1 tegument protein [Murid herpesvirus 3]
MNQKSRTKSEKSSNSDKFNILTVRTILAISKMKDRIQLNKLRIIDISISDTNSEILFHTEDGTLLHEYELQSEFNKKGNFLGFSGLILLDHEDALTTLRLSEFQLKRRLVHIIPNTTLEYTLCTILFALENLPLSKKILHKLTRVLYNIEPPTNFCKLLLKSTITLTNMCRYIFFDEESSEIISNIPYIILLCIQSKKMQSIILNDLLFKEINVITSLSLESRTLQGTNITVKEIMNTIYNTYLN